MKTTIALLTIASIIGTLTPANGYNYQSLRGKDTLLTDSTQLVEEESSGTKLPPLVPTSDFFTHGKKKPQGDWEPKKGKLKGQKVVHMSRTPYSDCTLTGGSAPYNFGKGHLHSGGDYCTGMRCWVFPVCSPIHGQCKKQHDDCHVLIIQSPGHTYNHERLQEELSKTKWEPYKY